MKKVIFGGVIALTYFSFKKAKEAKEALSSLTAELTGIRISHLSTKKIRMKVSFQLNNNTPYSVGISTLKLLKVKQLNFYNIHNGNFLASAIVNIDKIKIPKNGVYPINNIPIEISLTNFLSNISLLEGDFKDNIRIDIVLEALGKEYTINTQKLIA